MTVVMAFSSCNLRPEKLRTREDAAKARAELVDMWKEAHFERFKANEDASFIAQDGDTLKYAYSVFGEEPQDGRSLWISLHGGGGTTADMNDSQWNNQKRLYQPAEGIYLSPRAPWDAWDMWFQAPVDALFEELISTMVALKNVNPDKVYLLGYSAGGDGVWRLAPRMADHWAGASMMAGHPGDVSLVNVRNLPFTIWVGALDAAYDRNLEVSARGRELDSLQQNDPQGYIHECHVIEGAGHWMKLVDAAALPWMASFIRNPYPKKIVWRQEEVTRQCFYWLKVPVEQMERGKEVIVEVKDNVIDIIRCDYDSLTLMLNDEIVDLDREVTVTCGERVLYKGMLQRLRSTLARTLEERGDPSYMFDCELTLELKSLLPS